MKALAIFWEMTDMDLLKVYTHQVVSYHPPADRDELFAEIYDELCEEYADQLESDPSLSQAAFLDKTRQHPMKYASRLASEHSSYLVGPQFYFSFLSALKIGASITVSVFFMIALVSAVVNDYQWRTFLQVLLDIPATLLWVSAAILGVFIALEKGGERATWLENWKASDLKPADDHQSISRGDAFFDLSLSAFGLLWIFDVIQLPPVRGSEDVWIVNWTLSFPEWFWVLATGLLLFEMAFSMYRLTRNLWSVRLRLITIVLNGFWLGLLGFALLQPDLLSASGSAPADVMKLAPFINSALQGVLVVVMLVVAWDTLSHIRRLIDRSGSASEAG